MLMPPSSTATASKLVMIFIEVSLALRCCVPLRGSRNGFFRRDRDRPNLFPSAARELCPGNESNVKRSIFPRKVNLLFTSPSNKCQQNADAQRGGRRKILECMTWAGTGVLWTVAGGVPHSLGIIGEAQAALGSAPMRGCARTGRQP
jgi:hypothetical protein